MHLEQRQARTPCPCALNKVQFGGQKKRKDEAAMPANGSGIIGTLFSKTKTSRWHKLMFSYITCLWLKNCPQSNPQKVLQDPKFEPTTIMVAWPPEMSAEMPLSRDHEKEELEKKQALRSGLVSHYQKPGMKSMLITVAADSPAKNLTFCRSKSVVNGTSR